MVALLDQLNGPPSSSGGVRRDRRRQGIFSPPLAPANSSLIAGAAARAANGEPLHQGRTRPVPGVPATLIPEAPARARGPVRLPAVS
jgi:hypothetical protein